jgi:integrase/recombinase XerD
MLSGVKQFMSYLKEYDYIVSDPAKAIQYAKEPKSLPRGILTASEARKILHAPDTTCVIGYRDRTILEILYTSAIRKDELITLTLGDVDYNDGFLRVIG